jgi:general secretion pathway protein M
LIAAVSVSLSGITHAYARLAPRERMLTQVAGGVTLLVLLYFMVSWFQNAKADLRLKIAAKERQLDEIQELRRTYLQLKAQAESVTSNYTNRPQNFSLFSFLDGVGTKTVSREKILAMSPSSKTVGDQYVEESVEMRLSGVSLNQVVGLLYEVENAPTPLLVSRLQMKKRFNDPYNFDVTLVVSSVKSA